MKHTINILGAFILLLMFAVSCADDSIDSILVDKPGTVAELEYLNDYDALKSYIDRDANPNFKLGAGVTVSDYIQKGSYYRWINENFDMVTAGNAMKYGSVVGDNGAMNFGSVVQFVEAAKEAGIEIYGHTLLWHAQQNKKYLALLMADKEIESDDSEQETVLKISTPNAKDNVWDWQINYTLPQPLTSGTEYTLKMRAMASSSMTVAFWRFDGTDTNYGPDFGVGETWTDVSITFTPTINATTLQFNFGTFEGELFFDDIVLTETGSDVNLVENGTFDVDDLTGWAKPGWHGYTFMVSKVAAGPNVWWTQLVNNNDVESDDVTSYYSTEPATGGPHASTIEEGVGVDGSRAIVVRSGDNPANDWDTQFFVKSSKVLPADAKYRFSMKYRAEKPATGSSQAHFNPGEYQHYDFIGQLNFTTEWQTIEASGIVSPAQAGGDKGMMTIAFNLAILKEANTYYFDDISWEIEESGNKMPQTEEEIADTLTYALTNWISGMMNATDGYVKHWDVVNEPISGADTDGDGFYDLWSKENVNETDATNNFYWGDYLGDDYVRLAVKLARQYGPADMKLFVNDYNLESDWDDNHKLKSLIHWIERWESDGETVIDGIGTQMHISYYMDQAIQASKEAHIVKMFELMAETGKLVRITELDMGIVDETGKTLKTNELTEAHHKLMSDYYNFILTKYFEIIPASQRAGITLWCPIDSPASSSWRGGEPTGLWSQNTKRKHTYAGFADGLAGK